MESWDEQRTFIFHYYLMYKNCIAHSARLFSRWEMLIITATMYIISMKGGGIKVSNCTTGSLFYDFAVCKKKRPLTVEQNSPIRESEPQLQCDSTVACNNVTARNERRTVPSEHGGREGGE